MTKKKTEITKVKEPVVALEKMGTQDVPAMLALVTDKINAIKQNLPKTNKTTGDLGNFGKIVNINSVVILIQAASSVLGKEAAYYEAAKKIIPKEIKTPSFKLDGSTAEAWLTDIKSRVVLVANKEQLTTLTKIQKTLESNLSVKDKLAKDLQNIQDLLNAE